MSKIYSVYIQRKSVAAQAQLNYTDQDRANNVFAALGTLDEREVFSDDFGAKINVDPSDIGNVMVVDAGKSFEFQAKITVMQHDAQTRAQQKVAGRPRIDLAPGARLNG